jgi:LmbE family N-acetylglucosaminyl deacetylase
MERNQQEVVEKVSEAYGFSSVHQLRFPTTKLDVIPMGDLVGSISRVVHDVQPSSIVLPFSHDPHSDHHCAFTAAYSCTKVFRYPWIRQVLMMETPSETDFAPALSGQGFIPNVFVDITGFIEQKIRILSLYRQEISQHPFPRSPEGCSALSMVRGAAAGCRHAEAFMLLKEII